MNVRYILQSKGDIVHAISPQALVSEAARRLDELGVGALVVVDGRRRVLGVISERDITRQVARSGAFGLADPVSSAMTREIVTASPSDTLDDLMTRMTDRRIRHLPVMQAGHLVGLVSIGDVVKLKIDLAETEARHMRDYITAG